MLKLASEMNDDTRIKCMLNSWVAVDENCGELTPASHPAHLRRSQGRRKAGRPAKYYLQCVGTINAIVIEAYTDAEALKLANELFEAVRS